MQNPKLSIIIPVDTKERGLSRTLSSYAKYFSKRFREFPVEIIVVVNETFYAEKKTVQEYMSKFPFIQLVDTLHDAGKGGAVALGFSKASGEFIGYFNQDGAVSPSEILKLY